MNALVISIDTDPRAAELDAICAEIRRGENIIVRAERTLDAKRLYEELHPETRQGAAPGKTGGGKKAKAATVASFDRYIAERTYLSARTVRLDVQIASGIAPEIRDRLRETEHASATRTLVYLAQHPDDAAELVEKFPHTLTKEIGLLVRRERRRLERQRVRLYRQEQLSKLPEQERSGAEIEIVRVRLSRVVRIDVEGVKETLASAIVSDEERLMLVAGLVTDLRSKLDEIEREFADRKAAS